MRFSERCLLWEERAWEATHVLPTAALLCVECELLVFGAGRKDQGEAEPLVSQRKEKLGLMATGGSHFHIK